MFRIKIGQVLLFLLSSVLFIGCGKSFQSIGISSQSSSLSVDLESELLYQVRRGKVQLVILSTPQQSFVARCSSVVSVQLANIADLSPYKFNGAIGLSVSDSSGSVLFYKDAECSQLDPAPLIQGDTATANFYFKGQTATSFVLKVELLTLLSAQQSETIVTSTAQVTPSGSNVTFSPNSIQNVAIGSTQTFAVTANSGYTLSTTIGGTCPSGIWSNGNYTTGTITADCGARGPFKTDLDMSFGD